MSAADLLIFFPLLPLGIFLAWGIWQQRKNPRLPLALAAGSVLTVAGILVSAAGVAVGAVVTLACCAFCGVLALLVRLLVRPRR